MIAGRALLMWGVPHEKGYEIDALDGPVLMNSLAVTLLDQAFPKGPEVGACHSHGSSRSEDAGHPHRDVERLGTVRAAVDTDGSGPARRRPELDTTCNSPQGRRMA